MRFHSSRHHFGFTRLSAPKSDFSRSFFFFAFMHGPQLKNNCNNFKFVMRRPKYPNSRQGILDWINNDFGFNRDKIESLCDGAAQCQIMDCLYPGEVELNKVNFKAKNPYEYINNLKVLQRVFTKKNIKKPIDVQALIKGKYQDNFEFILWIKKHFDGLHDGSAYDPFERRKLCKMKKKKKKKAPKKKGSSKSRNLSVDSNISMNSFGVPQQGGSMGGFEQQFTPQRNQFPYTQFNSVQRGQNTQTLRNDHFPQVVSQRKPVQNTFSQRQITPQRQFQPEEINYLTTNSTPHVQYVKVDDNREELAELKLEINGLKREIMGLRSQNAVQQQQIAGLKQANVEEMNDVKMQADFYFNKLLNIEELCKRDSYGNGHVPIAFLMKVITDVSGKPVLPAEDSSEFQMYQENNMLFSDIKRRVARVSSMLAPSPDEVMEPLFLKEENALAPPSPDFISKPKEVLPVPVLDANVDLEKEEEKITSLF